ncbi:MAG: alpha/beta fold hydrolase [Steroidobacteraceae bacterium]|nr:alpha/beta fold hydrolase [Steroidobacteraceae bacterium]
MSKAIGNGLFFEYETFGSKDDAAIVLIAGLGFQLIDWPVTFCETLANAGLFVVRYDNRDIGLSQKLEESGLPDLSSIAERLKSGETPQIPYSLEDMAADLIGLLDAISLKSVHVAGMSMGGMIAQLIAIHHRDRVLSLTSMMSSTSDPSLPPPSAKAAAVLMSAPASDELAAIVAYGLEVNDVIGSPGFRWDRAALKAHIVDCVRRNYCPGGYMRQYAAVEAAQSRVTMLPSITAPTLVIHGREDHLIAPEAGEETARLIPGASLELIEGMGHDLSPALCEHLAGLILSHVLAH